MPELTVVVRVPMPKQPSLGALERAIFRALQAAGRELLVQAFGLLEQAVITGARQRRRRRYLITRFGELRFTRWQTRTDDGHGYASTEGHDRVRWKTFYALAASRAGITRPAEVFFISEGAGWPTDLSADWIAPTAVGLDQFHSKLVDLARLPAIPSGPLVGMGDRARSGSARPLDRLPHAVARDRSHGGTVLFGYLAEGIDAFHT